jgi:hypothetical protein
MSAIKFSPRIVKMIEKYRKHCFWRGLDLNAKKPPLAAWHLAIRPKKEGGMGIINLKTQNEALLLKNMDKFFNRQDCPWVNLIWTNYYRDGKLQNLQRKGSFWWSAIMKLLDKFKGIAMVKLNDGTSAYMWQDLWNGMVRKET